MSHPVRSMRLRTVALGGALVMALSLSTAPAVLAQDDGPDATVVAFMDAVAAKDFEALPTFFCEEYADQASELDLAAMTEGLPEGSDAQALLDAFILDTDVQSVEVVSQSDTEAVVHLVGSMSLGINTEALAPFIESMLAATGEEVTPDMVEMMSGMIASEFDAMSTEIDEEITLVPGETMPWLICDELGAGTETTDGMDTTDSGAEATAPASEDAAATEGMTEDGSEG